MNECRIVASAMVKNKNLESWEQIGDAVSWQSWKTGTADSAQGASLSAMLPRTVVSGRGSPTDGVDERGFGVGENLGFILAVMNLMGYIFK